MGDCLGRHLEALGIGAPRLRHDNFASFPKDRPMTTTPATVEGLMPCPFCGSDPNFQTHTKFGPRFFCDFGPDHAVFIGGKTPEDAAAKWNRRAERLAAQPSDASAVQAAEQFPLPPAKVQAYADTNGLPPADVKTCESCPTCGAPVTVFQPKVGEPIYTHKPADGVASAAEVAAVDSFVRSAPRREPQDTSNDPPFAGVVAIHQLVTPCKHCNAKQGEAHSVTCPYDVDSSRGGEQ
jgi:hypothetical protein